MAKHSALTQDAQNRALRTFVQGLAIDVGLALAFVVYNAFNTAEGWNDIDWRVMGFLVLKTVLVTAASYVMRRFLDKSAVPTPLPPAPVPPPNEAQPEPTGYGSGV